MASSNHSKDDNVLQISQHVCRLFYFSCIYKGTNDGNAVLSSPEYLTIIRDYKGQLYNSVPQVHLNGDC